MGYMYSKCLTPGDNVDKQTSDNKSGIIQENTVELAKSKEENKNQTKPYLKNPSVNIKDFI